MPNKAEIVEIESTEIVDGREVTEFRLRLPFEFEGKRYEKLDLSSIGNLTGKDLKKVIRMMGKTMDFEFLPEITMDYIFALCAVALNLPLEFFDSLNAKDAIQLKMRVIGFLFS